MFCCGAIVMSAEKVFATDLSVDFLGDFLEPDILLPTQLLMPDEKGIDGPERKLMAAVLSDGIEVYLTLSTSVTEPNKDDLADASEWVWTQDHSYVFSFDNVCESLGISPNYLRFGLERYLEKVKASKVNEETRTIAWKKVRRPRKH